jgi:carboxyl-terminal processing protease
MKRLLGCLGIVVTVLLLLGVGLAGGIALDRQVLTKYVPIGHIPPDADSSFKLMAEAWNTIYQSYVDRPAIQAQTLTYGAIGGMVGALGDTGHSRFLSPEMVQLQDNFTTGQFEGIGAYVEMKEGHGPQ